MEILRLGTFFWLQARFYPSLARCSFGVPRAGSKSPPVGDCSSSWLLWHDEKTTLDVGTTNGPDPLKRDQRTLELGLVTAAYHDDTYMTSPFRG